MAPEQARGERVDRRADVFAAGMIIWEILAGRRLFKGVTDVAVLQRIVGNQIPSPRTVAPDVPERLEAICMKALAHRREDRHATAADLATELEEALDALACAAPCATPASWSRRTSRPISSRFKALVESQLSGSRIGHDAHDPATFDPVRSGSGRGSSCRSSTRRRPSRRRTCAIRTR